MSWRRKFYRGHDFQRAISIEELRAMARARTPNFVLEYVEGGAENEATLDWNRAALDAIRLLPNTLVDTSARQQRATLFGREIPTPLVIAPTGLNGVLRHRGDVLLARAA